MKPFAFLLLLTLGLAACSEDNPSGNTNADDIGNSLHPLSIGSSWTYGVSFSRDVVVTDIYDTLVHDKTWHVFDFSWDNTREYYRQEGNTWIEWEEEYPDAEIPFLKDAPVGTTWSVTIDINDIAVPEHSIADYAILATDTTHRVNDTTYNNVTIVQREIFQKRQSDNKTIGYHKAQFYYARGVGLLELLPLVPGRELNRTLKSYTIE